MAISGCPGPGLQEQGRITERHKETASCTVFGEVPGFRWWFTKYIHMSQLNKLYHFNMYSSWYVNDTNDVVLKTGNGESEDYLTRVDLACKNEPDACRA